MFKRRWLKSKLGLAGARPSVGCPSFGGTFVRRDALLQVPNYCGDHHLSRRKGTSIARISPGLGGVPIIPSGRLSSGHIRVHRGRQGWEAAVSLVSTLLGRGMGQNASGRGEVQPTGMSALRVRCLGTGEAKRAAEGGWHHGWRKSGGTPLSVQSGFQPSFVHVGLTWAVGPGWNGCGPLALNPVLEWRRHGPPRPGGSLGPADDLLASLLRNGCGVNHRGSTGVSPYRCGFDSIGCRRIDR